MFISLHVYVQIWYNIILGWYWLLLIANFLVEWHKSRQWLVTTLEPLAVFYNQSMSGRSYLKTSQQAPGNC